mmetsp:Transcript_17745/g.38885  ORF Transcript_17745/g.38885 Transcript_17745/m.38885 type:complete len:210 (+) Transcript_17745:562-1191(+)
MHLSGIVAIGDVRNGNAASALLEEPADEFFATTTLLEGPCDERNVAHILQDGSRSHFQFFAGRALLPERVAQFVVLKNHAIRVEAFRVGGLLPDSLREVARALRLHAAHDLEFRTTAAPLGPANDEHFAGASTFAAVLVHEEHEHAPFLFDGAQRSAASPRDVTDTLAWNVHNGAVFAIFPAFNVHWSFELIEEPLHVLLATLPILTSA